MINFIKLFFSLILLLILSSCANSLFYHPEEKVYQTPKDHNQVYEDVSFKSLDKVSLTGWFIPAKDPSKCAGTVIHFHGNAQNMTSHYSYVRWVPELNYNLFVFDYRGYGKSAGSPSPGGTHKDAIAAWRYVAKRPDVDPDKLFSIAQSIGGAIAIPAVAKTKGEIKIRGMVIDSTFHSYEAIAAYHLGYGKFSKCLSKCLITEKWSPVRFIKQVAPTPLLFIHGYHDEAIPYAFGNHLYKQAEEPKFFLSLPCGHTEALAKYVNGTVRKILDFFETDYDLKPKHQEATENH